MSNASVRQGRGECKMRGGKLIAANVTASQTRVLSCILDGDFFAEGNLDKPQVIADIEAQIAQCALPIDADTLGNKIRVILDTQQLTLLIGATPQTIVTAVQRALLASDGIAQAENEHDKQSNATQETLSAPDLVPDRLLSDFRNRWKALALSVVHDEPLMPSRQMATDHALAQAVARGECGPMIRIWEWAASTVVIGRFQSLSHQVDLEAAQQEGVSVVRRVTGGGAMFVEPKNTITYSLYAPLNLVEAMSIEQSYRCCDDWILSALRQIGIDAQYEPINDLSSPSGKIGGAAQRRYAAQQGGPGAVLHHVTMSYDIDAEKMSRILRISREKMRYKAVQSAVKRVDPLRSQSGLGREEIIGKLIAFLLSTIPGAHTGTVPSPIRQTAAVLDATRFSQDSWTRGIV
ncbi:MAG: lipoate--protein ligase family protein [Bifidobacterium sp.]|nr:lipoate--protein ligase family protein [Bifidobacterium sp.]MCH4174954.1 lipoate--protein ligase family protein [Bifidobacterium sp.]